ncbi:MAG: TolC family protein [Prevotella sp.]|jgi:outer membrane protein TolC|nr:TolC family protein [Prevotella sp.]
MRTIIYIILLSGLPVINAGAQDTFDKVLESVEANNTTLKVYRKQAIADKTGNRTGINMANPEIESGYLWGSPGGEGNRTDLNISQTFDFPTVYRYRSQVANGKNKQVDLACDRQRRDILQQARILCVELTFRTKEKEQLAERLKHAKELSDAYTKRFDKGDIDILKRNKTKLDLLNTEKLYQINGIEINTLRAKLQQLNGGEPLEYAFNSYPDYLFPLDFAEWFGKVKENNPSLRLAEQEVALSKKQEQLARALNLPRITAGYTSERVSGATLQGFTIGVSIPLWEGKNTVKHQKARTAALQMQQADTRLQFQNTLKNRYDKAYGLSVLLNEYQEILNVADNRDLLKKALDKGQLSLIDYLLELSVYYETLGKYIETEKDYQLAVSELQQWER